MITNERRRCTSNTSPKSYLKHGNWGIARTGKRLVPYSRTIGREERRTGEPRSAFFFLGGSGFFRSIPGSITARRLAGRLFVIGRIRSCGGVIQMFALLIMHFGRRVGRRTTATDRGRTDRSRQDESELAKSGHLQILHTLGTPGVVQGEKKSSFDPNWIEQSASNSLVLVVICRWAPTRLLDQWPPVESTTLAAILQKKAVIPLMTGTHDKRKQLQIGRARGFPHRFGIEPESCESDPDKPESANGDGRMKSTDPLRTAAGHHVRMRLSDGPLPVTMDSGKRNEST